MSVTPSLCAWHDWQWGENRIGAAPLYHLGEPMKTRSLGGVSPNGL